MLRSWWALALVSTMVAALLTVLLRRYALRAGMLDQPNERSSHSVPTPRGGGVAIVVTSMLGVAMLAALRAVDPDLAAALLGGGVAVAAVGFVDDRHKVSVRTRLAVHIAAAAWALGWLAAGSTAGAAGNWPLWPIWMLIIVWSLNLFNFMDGIDGIAASEAVFISWGAAALAAADGGGMGITAVGVVFGAACCGFLLFNWPPARIFMGDVGSGYIGFIVAVLAIASAWRGSVALPVWFILGGVFAADATVTLIRRLLVGEHVGAAHRSHAYQRLARRWRSHGRVTATVLAVNFLWLLPLALLASWYPDRSVLLAGAALLPLTVATLMAGAGKSD